MSWIKDSVSDICILNSAQFQSRLLPSAALLKSALYIAEKCDYALDMTRSYLGVGENDCWTMPIQRWAESSKTLTLSAESEQQLMKNLLNVFIRGGFFKRPAAYDAALTAVADHGSIIQMRLLLSLNYSLDSYDINVVNRFAITSALQRQLWNHDTSVTLGENDVCCQMISKASDEYLNFDLSLDQRPYSLLKVAILNARPLALAALIKRFPAVDFDVSHKLISTFAEPLTLSIPETDTTTPHGKEIVALIASGEQIVQRYHHKLSILIQKCLQHRLLKPLISIVVSFSNRRPLSATLLTIPRS